MDDSKSTNPEHESLVDLSKRLTAVLESPEGPNISTFAHLVDRMKAELGIVGDGTVLWASAEFVQTNEDWAHLLDERSGPHLLSEEDTGALGHFLAK